MLHLVCNILCNVYVYYDVTQMILIISIRRTSLIISKFWNWLSLLQMKKLLGIIVIIIIFLIMALYFLDGLEYTDAEREWCKEHRPLLPIQMCAKEFGY